MAVQYIERSFRQSVDIGKMLCLFQSIQNEAKTIKTNKKEFNLKL